MSGNSTAIDFDSLVNNQYVKKFLETFRVATRTPAEFISAISKVAPNRGLQLCLDYAGSTPESGTNLEKIASHNCLVTLDALVDHNNPSGPFSLFLVPGGKHQQPEQCVRYIDERFDETLEYSRHIVLVGSNRLLPGDAPQITEKEDLEDLKSHRFFKKGQLTSVYHAPDAIRTCDIAQEGVKQLLDVTRISRDSEICILVSRILRLKMALAWPERARALNYFHAKFASPQGDQSTILSMSLDQKLAVIVDTLIAAAEAKIAQDKARQRTVMIPSLF